MVGPRCARRRMTDRMSSNDHRSSDAQHPHRSAESRETPSRSPTLSRVRSHLVLGQMVLAAVRFDDEAIAHEKVDAAHSRNRHLSPQVDSRGPQSQSDRSSPYPTRSWGRIARRDSGVRSRDAATNRSRVSHRDHPLVQHRVQHNRPAPPRRDSSPLTPPRFLSDRSHCGLVDPAGAGGRIELRDATGVLARSSGCAMQNREPRCRGGARLTRNSGHPRRQTARKT